jgi:CheY-like chemotaxis protein
MDIGGAVPRILIVDDEPAIRSLLSETFVLAGFEVRTAANGLQAMMFLASESFNAMLSDVTMPSIPRVDGHDLARWVSKYCRSRSSRKTQSPLSNRF